MLSNHTSMEHTIIVRHARIRYSCSNKYKNGNLLWPASLILNPPRGFSDYENQMIFIRAFHGVSQFRSAYI